MKIKLLSALCSVALILVSIPFGAFQISANAAVFKGSGTTDDPYQISSADDLFKLSKLINDTATNSKYAESYYVQTSDIDLDNRLFIPIGCAYSDEKSFDLTRVFLGVYNGNFHSIYNLNVNNSKGQLVGLFGRIGKGANLSTESQVKNLSVYGQVVSDHSGYTGGIAGDICCKEVSIINCSFNGSVEGVSSVGGIAGRAYCGGEVTSCYVNADITSNQNVGGIVGTVDIGNNRPVNQGDNFISNSYFAGSLSGENVGGIVGVISNGLPDSLNVSINNNYYLNASSDKGVGTDNAKGCTKLVSVALKACADMLGSPFVDNNEEDFNDGYPIFEWQSTPYQFKGSGTEEDPYQISNKDELKTMRDLINSTYYNFIYGHANYIQIADIDLENESWEPIGLGRDGEDGQGAYNYKNRMFYAKYNGNKHIIKNLNVSGEWMNAGLFSYIRGEYAGVNDLVVYGNVATSNGYSVGGIVGEMQYGSEIKNCAFIGDVTANEEASHVGGVIGQIWAADDVINCYHNGNVTGGKFAGGVAGQVAFGTSNIDGQSSNIMNCYQVNGKISGIEYSGAVIGNCMYANGIQNTITVYNCYASSDCGANELSKNATSDNTMLLPKSLLKKVAEDLGDAYVDNPDKSLNDGYPVFTWQANNTMVIGDVNDDGEFNVSDVVLLQKWLLAVPNTHLSNWKAADFCKDDRLDVFDLCLMKRMLINENA